MKDLFVFGLCLFGIMKESISAPALISQMGDSFDESLINNDTNPDPCYIAGNIYYHGQQISRQDECEFCLCVDGEMFCYWQCPDDDEDKETPDGPVNPARVRSTTPKQINNTPATDSISSSTTSHIGSSTSQNFLRNTSTPALVSTRVESTSPRVFSTGVEVLNATLPELLQSNSETSSVRSMSIESSTVVLTSEKPVSCFVLGVEYKLGEVLPHNTGTCLECKCGSDGRVTCSPNDCVASEPQDEMFNSHHQDSNSLDMFDVDMF